MVHGCTRRIVPRVLPARPRRPQILLSHRIRFRCVTLGVSSRLLQDLTVFGLFSRRSRAIAFLPLLGSITYVMGLLLTSFLGALRVRM